MEKEKRELLDKTFHTFMDVGLGGENLNLLHDIVAKDVVGFGTTIDEKIFGVKQLEDLIIRQKEQSAGLELSWKIDTFDTHISSDENTAIFTNDLILYLTIDGNTIEMYMRFSVVLDYVHNKWMVVHWHGSKPEHVESKKDTWGVQTWKEKAEELEKQVAERTADLLVKNRELEIEAALEKVRAVAMGMKKPEDMLDVCKTISVQLQQLGVAKIRNVQIAIIDENIGQYLCYQYFTHYDKTTIEKTEYLKSPVEYGMVRQMLASRDGHFIGNLSGKELEAFRSHRKEENHFYDPLLDGALELDYCFLSIGEGGLGLTLYHPVTEEILTLFKRFHHGFSLTYQRFRDIQKALAQAREAQIEVAIERVRAQSMAMHHPDDLDKVNKELLSQLNLLQIPGLTGVTFYLINENGWVNAWDFSSPGNIGAPNSYMLQFDFAKYEMMGEPFRVLQQTDLDYYVADYTLEKLEQATYELEEINPATASVFREALANGKLTHQWSACAKISGGILGVDLVNPPSEDTKTIVMKMAGAFNQSYTRFLDLQKAEAQAREAQIEAALERIRSKSLAMYKTDDLRDVVTVLFEQLQGLSVNMGFASVSIFIFEEGSRNIKQWLRLPEGTTSLSVPYFEHPISSDLFDAKENGADYFAKVYTAEEKNTWAEKGFVLTDYRNLPDEFKTSILKAPGYAISITLAKNSGICIPSFIGSLPSQDDVEIMKRVGKVFEQAYIRFLDLQKAEAQAREAQIEAALEKVRSRSLAMHNSSELNEVVKVLFEKITELQVPSTAIGIQTFIEGSKDMQVFVCGDVGTGIVVNQYVLPYFDHPIVHDYLNAHKNKVEAFVGNYSKKVKDSFYDVILKLPELNDLAAEVKTMVHESDFYEVTIVPAEKSLIAVNDFLGNPLAESQVNILKRFAKVFDQAYTRFLDIQKAEGQAREAQIEAALEKVRSRTMGMQQSNELAEVANVLFGEMNHLVHNLWTCGFVLCESDRQEDEWWLSLEDGFSRGFYLPNVNDYAHATLYEGWLQNDTFRTVQLDGDKLQAHYDWLMEIPVAKNIFDDMEAAGMKRPDWQKLHAAYFSKGYLVIITREHCPEEEIFKRFATVFDQTYTRFLDLKKAEAQSKEAQIEAALERVRARSMAMHKTSELQDVINTVNQQLKNLEVDISGGAFITMNNTIEEKVICWGSGGTTDYIHEVIIPFIDRPIYNGLVEGIMKGPGFFTEEFTYEEKQEFFKHLFLHPPYNNTLDSLKKEVLARKGGYCRSCAVSDHTSIFINNHHGIKFSEQDNEILKRIGRVFDQAYARFLDIQKAEAQAKEAQIELSLERIRSQVTSMMESSDLLDIVVSMRSEFVKLGHEAHYFWHMRWLPETYAKAMTSGDGTKIGMVMTLPRHIHGDIAPMANWEKSKEPTYVLAMDAETAVDYVHKMITLGDFERVDPQSPTLDDIRHIGGLTFVMARTTHGEIGFSLPGVVPDPPKDAVETLVRFAGVFDLAYKRFEDLKTAEKDLIEIKAARERAEEALLELKATQSQLVQQEKLASLGQLTAGIAHEIKNPLNFVNNFSEVSIELIDEMHSELDQVKTQYITSQQIDISNINEAESILNDLKSNLSKIYQHGSRANSIVTSMLQHSRGGTGEKEPADLNALVKEYVNLCFHGMRAAKNPINVTISLDLDPKIHEISLIHEDFTRVIINLCNNAFDAMRQKKLLDPEDYQPLLCVRTKSESDFIVIEVKDNGPGIPDGIKDKILQPFFTTKKGTEGTGLGLSITHDIIKAHGGELTIETAINKGTSFIIKLNR